MATYSKGKFLVVPVEQHNQLVEALFAKRGYNPKECSQMARFCQTSSWHGVRTHNAIKAAHLDEAFGRTGGCVPNAEIEKYESRFKAVERWNANKKLGQATAYEAMERCMQLADEYGVGVVMVDNAFHYLWGAGYVIDAAKKGYIAYTNCTSALTEVVPFMGKYPTLGTNPHSWAFPTQDAIGYPICVDWATSTVAMGRVQQLLREGGTLPPKAAVDENGVETTDPAKAKSLLPFGAHKGYGLGLLNELYAAFGGGSLPTARSRWGVGEAEEKHTTNFYFQCVHVDSITPPGFAFGRDRTANVKAVIDDILGHGNEKCLLPGQIEADNAALSEKHGGLLFTEAEVQALKELAVEAGFTWDDSTLKEVEV